MNKSHFRKKYKALRASLSEEEIEDSSLHISNLTLELPIWDHTVFHLFMPMVSKKEVNTEYILHILQGRDKTVLIPKSNFESGEMKHILLQDNTAFITSSYGIVEPVDGISMVPDQIDVVFVPLLAFGSNGHRIGYGKGFYDRFLAQCSPKCLFIGLSFFESEELQDISLVDVPLHFCITPKKIYTF